MALKNVDLCRTGGISLRYANFVGKYPWLILILVALVVFSMAIPLFKLVEMPTFDNPVQGFRARGTKIRGRFLSVKLLEEKLDSGEYFCDPYCSMGTFKFISPMDKRKNKNRTKNSTGSNTLSCHPFIDPHRPDSVIVFEPKHRSTNMFSVDAVREMCRFENRVISNYRPLNYTCQSRKVDGTYVTLSPKSQLDDDALLPQNANSTFRHYSLGYYIGRIVGKSNCSLLTQEDISKATKVINQCMPAYKKGYLAKCYNIHFNHTILPKIARDQIVKNAKVACTKAKETCAFPGEVYAMLYFILDKGFSYSNASNAFAQYAALHLRNTIRSFEPELEQFYKDKFEDQVVSSNLIQVAGMRLSVEYNLYLEYTTKTLMLFVVAMGLIFLVMIIYLQSILMTVSTCFLVGFAFIIAWFSYAVALNFLYFPTMNCMAGLLLIAVCADDVFVYFDIWEQSKREAPDAPRSEWVYQTLKHAAASIFVTSFTTASAFFANTISSITDIRLFGVFAGLSILINFLLMITWIPAAVVISDQLTDKFKMFDLETKRCWAGFMSFQRRVADAIFGRYLPTLVNRFWFGFLLLFLLLGIAGIVVAFVNPGLQLPSSEYFQMYRSDHPFEVYTGQLKKRFAFSNDKSIKLPIQFVWGVKGRDNGHWYDPADSGFLELDRSVNIMNKEQQQFFLDFCHALKNTTFINENMRQHFQCFFDVIKHIMSYECINLGPFLSFFGPDQGRCCEQKNFPYEPDLMKECFTFFYQTEEIREKLAGVPILDFPILTKNYTPIAYVYSFQSTFDLKFSFNTIDKYYKMLNDFLNEQLVDAPSSLKNGWFSSIFGFYDLQLSLSQGTFLAMAVSLAVACLVLLLTSLNIVITFYAMLTIAFSIFVTVGTLVLMGWELNILESVAMTLAIGLSIDFSIHYGVAYRLCSEFDRVHRMWRSFQRVGSAVFMAAFTTFVAGLAIMPTHLHSYRQMGTFLMVVMLISYLYATFFFQSLCRTFGPQGNFGQIPDPIEFCRARWSRQNDDDSEHIPKDLHSESNGMIHVRTTSTNILDPAEENILKEDNEQTTALRSDVREGNESQPLVFEMKDLAQNANVSIA